MQNNDDERKTLYQQEAEKAVQCAKEQAAMDLADLEVIEANVSSRTDPLAHAHMRLQYPHWYIQITMHHRNKGAPIHAFYRVWQAEGAWKAVHVGWMLPKREQCQTNAAWIPWGGEILQRSLKVLKGRGTLLTVIEPAPTIQ